MKHLKMYENFFKFNKEDKESFKFERILDFNRSIYYEDTIRRIADVAGVNIDYMKNLGFSKIFDTTCADIKFKIKVSGTKEEVDKFKKSLESSHQ